MSDWKDIIKTVAPLVGNALGGPMGGMATKFIAGQLLGDENAPQEQLEQFIVNAGPDQMLKIKELDNAYKLELERIGLQDRSSARNLAQVTSIKPQVILSALYVSGYFVVLGLILTGSLLIPDQMMTIVNVLIGVLTASVTQIMNFWFGSSSGSKEKTGLIK